MTVMYDEGKDDAEWVAKHLFMVIFSATGSIIQEDRRYKSFYMIGTLAKAAGISDEKIREFMENAMEGSSVQWNPEHWPTQD